MWPYCLLNGSFCICSIGQLKNLKTLYICGNLSLTSIPESLFSISSLQKLDCSGCSALTSPPYAVCRHCLEAARKYYYDLKVEVGTNQHLVPVTVIGKTKAGKTSLVRSVQQNKRVLTERNTAEGKLNELTKVFKVCEAEMNKTSKLLFVDYRGQSIYHFSYQLTFKAQSVPLLVIDIEEFDR